jgi:hypothetical protein
MSRAYALAHAVQSLALVCLLLVTSVATSLGQKTAKDTTLKVPCASVPKGVKVTDAYLEQSTDSNAPRALQREVRLRQTVVVKVDGLNDLLKCAEEQDHKRSIVLFLDDRPLSDIGPYPPKDPQENLLLFPLKRTEASRDVWQHVLGKPGLGVRQTKISVGFSDGYPMPSTKSVSFRVLPRAWLWGWGVVLAILLLLFFGMAIQSDLLRDAVGEDARPGRRRAFSLGRAQASWWFFIIISAYLFIGMVTGDYSTTITGAVLVLLGISVGTTAFAAIIDSDRASSDPVKMATRKVAIKKAQEKLAAVEAELQATTQTIHDLRVKSPLDATETRQLRDAEAQHPELVARRKTLEEEIRTRRLESQGLLKDLLSDTNGVNLHRFQLVAWTLVLGIIFWVEVYRELAMPQFGPTLLALMGISSGTYVGLKLQEPKPEEDTPSPET